jgi:hypothetical protein
VPSPPPAATPLEIADLTPLGPAPIRGRMSLIARAARVRIGDRVCVIDKGVALCKPDAVLPDDDTYVFDDESVASLKKTELTVTNREKTLRATLEKSAVLRGDAIVWIEGTDADRHLVARDLHPFEPLLGPRTVAGAFSNLFGATCRTENDLFIHGNGLAVRRGKTWSAYAAPEGRLSCSTDAVITSVKYSDGYYSLRASRCGADSCREESGSLREWTYASSSADPRLGPVFLSAGSSLAIVDDRDGLWVRTAPVAAALGTTPRRIVLDSSPIGGKHRAWLRDVLPVVGGLVLLIESQGNIYAVWLHGDAFSAVTTK